VLLPIDVMKCPRCKSAMKELKRSFHKKRKWICPECGCIRFQEVKPKSKK
jgi:transposase-like protein